MCPMGVYTASVIRSTGVTTTQKFLKHCGKRRFNLDRDAGGHVCGSGYSGSKFARTLLRSLELCNTQGLRYEHGDPPMCRYTMLVITVYVTLVIN